MSAIVSALLAGLIISAVAIPSISILAYADHELGANEPIDITEVSSGRYLHEGDILYVALGPGSPPTVELEVKLDPPYTTVTPYTDLPVDSTLVPDAGSSSTFLFTWPLDTLCSDSGALPSECPLPAAFGINLNVTSDVIKSVLIVIEDVASIPVIEFDRTGYLPGDVATITVTDVHANLNANVPDTISESNVEVRFQGGDTINVALQENLEDPTKFSGTFEVQDGNWVTARYGSAEAKADIGLALFFNDDDIYYPDDTPRIVVRDPSANTPNVDEVFVTVGSEDARARNLIRLVESGAGSGEFSGEINLVELGSSIPPVANNIITAASDVIAAAYKNQRAKATIIEPKFEMSREEYGNYDLATIEVVDKNANGDKNSRDIIEVTVTSTDDPATITNTLLETGPNTAIFASRDAIFLSNNTEIREQNPQALLVRDGSEIRASYSGQADAAAANVRFPPLPEPFPPRGLNGTGGSGALPTTMRTILSGITIVSCTSYGGDVDLDGICNNWEYPYTGGYLKINYGGSLHTFTYTCDPTCPNRDHKDIFVEIDYESGHNPNDTAITNVKNAFNSAPVGNPDSTTGIRLHVKESNNVGTLAYVDTWSNLAGADEAPDDDSYSEIKEDFFGVGFSLASTPNKARAWAQVAHYVYWANKLDHDRLSSGIAEVVGNDAIVSLGNFFNGVGTVYDQQGTLMHELGHNLGLDHGGGLESYPTGQPATYDWLLDHAVNCKPLYPSVMSHSRQITNAFTGNTLDYSHGWFSPTDTPNYVPQTGDQLDENNIPHVAANSPPPGQTVTILYAHSTPRTQVTVVIGSSTPTQIDWDGDGTIETGAGDVYGGPNDIFDVGVGRCERANNPLPPDNELHDFNDWGMLVLDHRFWNTAGMSTGSSIMAPGMTADDQIEMYINGIRWLDSGIQNSTVTDPDRDSDIKADFHDALIAGEDSVASLLTSLLEDGGERAGAEIDIGGNLKEAADRLEDLREDMDGSAGGERSGDLIDETSQRMVLERVDNNLAALKPGFDLPYTGKNFNVTSQTTHNVYQITGESDTITTVAPTFAFDDETKEIFLDFVGGIGNVVLEIPQSITNTVTSVTVLSSGDEIEFEQLRSSTNDTIRVELKDVPLHARKVSIYYGPPKDPLIDTLPPSVPGLRSPTGELVDNVTAGQQVVLSSTIKNKIPEPQPYVIVFEVRNESDVTVYLQWQMGTAPANGQIGVGISWTPPSAGEYKSRVLVISELENPEPRSPVVESLMTVR